MSAGAPAPYGVQMMPSAVSPFAIPMAQSLSISMPMAQQPVVMMPPHMTPQMVQMPMGVAFSQQGMGLARPMVFQQ